MFDKLVKHFKIMVKSFYLLTMIRTKGQFSIALYCLQKINLLD